MGDETVGQGTYDGYRRYNAACSRCHGPDGAGGSFAPSLIEALPAYDVFTDAVLYGRRRGTSVMNGFSDDPAIAEHLASLYAYLQARSSGAMGRGPPVFHER